MPEKIKFIWPIDKVTITQRFGERPEYYKKYGMRGHNGLDLRTKYIDSPLGKRYLIAPADGVITAVILTPGSGYGNHIDITFKDGSKMTFGHLKKSYVYKGQVVKQAQLLALTNNTGDSSAAHLHLTYKPKNPDVKNGYFGAIDPLPLFPKL